MRRICFGLLAFFLAFGSGACSVQPAPQTTAAPAPTPTATRVPSPTIMPTPSTTLPPGLAGIRELLPAGTITADLLQLVIPPRLKELNAKLLAAAQRNPGWWSDYVRSAPAGQTLPYHPNMGLTEAEYAEMLQLFEGMTFQKIGEVTFIVTAAGEHRFVLDGGKTLPRLTGIEVDLGQDLVRTPHGVAAEHSDVEPSEHQTATGPWGGVQWSMDTRVLQGTVLNGTLVRFGLGRLQQGGRAILYYQVERFENGQRSLDIVLVLHYSP